MISSESPNLAWRFFFKLTLLHIIITWTNSNVSSFNYPNHCPHPSYSHRHFLLNIDDIRELKRFSKILLRMHAKIASLSTYRPYTNTTVWAKPFALSSNNSSLITVRSKYRMLSQKERLGKKNHEWYFRAWDSKKLPSPDSALAVRLPGYNIHLGSIFHSPTPKKPLYVIGRKRMIERPVSPQFLAFPPLLSPWFLSFLF